LLLLLLLQTEVDQKSLPTDKLSAVSLSWCQRVGSSATALSEARNDALVLDAIQQSIDRVNEAAISHAQHIQKWSILPRDFSVPGGELGMLSFHLSNNNNNNYVDIYGAVIMTEVIARVHSVHLVNVEQ